MTDKTVSSVHCWITKRDDGTFLLEDNGSSNGVRILGAHVQSLVLVRSMRLLLGNTEIVVVGSDERVASPGALPIRSCTTRP